MGLGTWSEYCVFPETHLIKLESEPDHIDSGIGSVLSTGMFVTSKGVAVESGSNCTVFGSNSLALIIAYCLKKADGCDKVVVVGEENMREYVESFEGIFILDEGEATDI
jgi:threonine dehydrogenase-like Zn-dependent dehydrogenase